MRKFLIGAALLCAFAATPAYANLNVFACEPEWGALSTEVGGDNGSLADALRDNIPPELKVEGARTRTVKVGQPLSLAVIAGDPDNLPARRDGKPSPGARKQEGTMPPPAVAAGRGAAAPNSAAVVYRPPVSVVASSGPGLRFAWTVYRGKAANVTFKPEQMKAWEDTRVGSNSPPDWVTDSASADGPRSR